MKKALLFLFVGGCFSAQNVQFTDINFKKAIIKAYPEVDANKDGEISFEDAKRLTSIRNLSSFPSITNANGIEAFTNLTELDLGQKDLTSIDVSANTKLITLNLRQNKLQGSFNVSNLSELKTLELNKNLLTEVILPQNGNLEVLYCNENKLTQLNVTNLPNLKKLILVSNSIFTLDLSQNLLLDRLHVDNNKLVNLNLDNLSKLNWISVNNNLLTTITFANNPLLKTILAQNNRLESLNFQDGFANALTMVNLTGNLGFNRIIKDCSDTLPIITVNVEDNCSVLGVNLSPRKVLVIYPNPASENLYFSNSVFVENYSISDAEGKLVTSKNLNREVKLISVEFLSKGVFTLRVRTSSGEVIHRFLKK